MINLIIKLWRKYRPVSKRFYRYGTVALKYGLGDDRTKAEKICDAIDDYLADWQERKKIRKIERRAWKSFQCGSTGQTITSMADIRKIEREKGWIYMDDRDIAKEAKRHAEYNKQRFNKKVKKDLVQIMKDIHNGRSFVREAKDKIAKGQYGIGYKEPVHEAREI